MTATTITKSRWSSIATTTTTSRPALNVEVTISLIYFSNFWRFIDWPLINCDIELDLSWAKDYVVTLSINDDIKFFEKKNQGFRRTISWSKYRSEITTQPKNNNLDYLIYPSFRNVNRLFVLPFKNDFDALINNKRFFWWAS